MDPRDAPYVGIAQGVLGLTGPAGLLRLVGASLDELVAIEAANGAELPPEVARVRAAAGAVRGALLAALERPAPAPAKPRLALVSG